MKQIKNVLIGIMIVAVIGVTAGVISQTGVKDVYADQQSDKNSIQVNGQGKIKVKPDMAVVNLGVKTEDKDAKKAQEENASKMDKVVKALQGLGIDSDDMKTQNYSIYPRYQYIEKTGENQLDRYEVNNTIAVTVRDISTVGKVIDTAVNEGVNLSNSIQFTTSKESAYYRQALEEAVKSAKGKADTIAKAIGVTIGNPKTVVEQSYGGETIRYESVQNTAKLMAADTATPIQSGELEITATVNVTYEY